MLYVTKGTTTVENLLDSEDIQYMLGALKTLEVKCRGCDRFSCFFLFLVLDLILCQYMSVKLNT